MSFYPETPNRAFYPVLFCLTQRFLPKIRTTVFALTQTKARKFKPWCDTSLLSVPSGRWLSYFTAPSGSSGEH